MLIMKKMREYFSSETVTRNIVSVLIVVIAGAASVVGYFVYSAPGPPTLLIDLGLVQHVGLGRRIVKNPTSPVVGVSTTGGTVVGFDGGEGDSIEGQYIVETERGDYAVQGVPVFSPGATANLAKQGDDTTLCIRQAVNPQLQCFAVR